MPDDRRTPDDPTREEPPARSPDEPAMGEERVPLEEQPLGPGSEPVPRTEDRAPSEPRDADDHRTSPRLSTTATVVLGVAVFLIFAYVGFWVMSRVLGG